MAVFLTTLLTPWASGAASLLSHGFTGQLSFLVFIDGLGAASLIKFREATETDAGGVVFLFVLNRKTTPASRPLEAPQHFIDRSATPPCSDARRGMY